LVVEGIVTLFWVLAPCGFTDRCRGFGEESSGLKMESVYFCETLAYADLFTRHQYPHHLYRREKSKISSNVLFDVSETACFAEKGCS
jgi:hypothetical protein